MDECKQITIVVENAGKNYSAYIKEVDGLIGTGATIGKTIESLAQSIILTDAFSENDDSLEPLYEVSRVVIELPKKISLDIEAVKSLVAGHEE